MQKYKIFGKKQNGCRLALLLLCLLGAVSGRAQSDVNVVDEVVWVVGDDPILLSEVEDVVMQAKTHNATVERCKIPEQLAVQKLYLHQAAIDSVEVSESDIITAVNEQINYYTQVYGSKENFEAMAHQSVQQVRENMLRTERDRQLIRQEQYKLTENVKVTPAEVREYFKDLPADSLPLIATQVEVQIITRQPQPTRDEISRVEETLREYARRVNEGESEFSTLARFYSEDAGSARNGGELDYMGKGQLVPEFANVAFALNDPKKVSKVVRTEFGYHIIQLIDKMGDRVKVRHILLKPQIPDSAYTLRLELLDSIAADIRAGKYTFEEGATKLSDDKDTKNNKGLLSYNEGGLPTSRFKMDELNADVAKVVEKLEVGQISEPFIMTNAKGYKVCAIVKLKNRIDEHRASMTEDFQVLHDVVYDKRCEEKLQKWVKEKIKNTYVRIKPEWRACDFEFDGWIKQ